MPLGGAEEIAIDQIRPNRFQPRKTFAPEQLAELAASIREHGLLQPVVVRPTEDGFYEMIAGERRWRASREAGLTAIPAIVREITDDDALTLALVENLQREDLNPVEKGLAFKEMSEKFGLTQEEIARRTGKDRSTVANFIRLLDLPDTVLDLVSRGTISMGHARTLLGLNDEKKILDLCERIVREGLSVRDVENSVTASRAVRPPLRGRAKMAKSAHIRDLEDRLRERFGLKVTLDTLGARGKMVVYFTSEDEFQRLLDSVGLGDAQ